MFKINSLQSPLASKLLKSVLSVYLLVALVITALQLFLEFQEEEQRLQAELSQMSAAFMPVVVTSVWNLDADQLQRTVDGMWVNEAIGRVTVVDDLGQQLVSRNRETSFLGLQASQLPWYSYDYEITYSDSFETNRVVGQLSLASSSLVVLQRAMSTFLYTLVNAFIKTLVLWLIIYSVLTRFVSRPLHQLTRAVDQINPDSKQANNPAIQNLEKINADDELGSLAQSFSLLDAALIKKNQTIEERQQNLETMVDELEKVSSAKTVFLSHMSHELRTPLNGILGMIEFLKDTNLDQEQAKHAATLTKSGEQLLAVINNVLDISKIESGKVELDISEFDLSVLVSDCVASFKALAQQKGLELELSLPGSMPSLLQGDQLKLRQVLSNLISNAIKFTPAGRVTVRVEVQPAGDAVHCALSVADTGVGMSEKEQGQLFKSFSQIDGSSTRKFGGTGLGLAISKQLIELMDGSISQQSVPDQGTTFTVKLDLVVAKDGASLDSNTGQAVTDLEIEGSIGSERMQFGHLNVLVAEDNPVNQLVIEGMLKKLGIAADMASDGRQAVDKCCLSDQSYDLVLMDIEMPELDGWQATRQLREANVRANSGEPLKIIGLSAHALNIEEQVTRERGMDGYISKPVSLENLSRVLQTV